MTYNIMIVEDEPELTSLYTMAIEESGNYAVVETAADGERAIEKFKKIKDRVDLIVMDQRIPSKKGIEVTKDILEINPEVKILFASADSLAKFEAKSLGVVGFLQKPFEMSMLTFVIRKVLEPEKIISEEEITIDKGQKYFLESGYQYLIKEEKPFLGFDIFVDQVTHGYRGLCITRQHPRKVRVNYGLKKTPIIWLSQSSTENTIDPSNISKIVHTVRNFVREHNESVVILDGLEYLKIQNGFTLVMKYLNMINDIIMEEGAKFIVSINPRAFSENEIAFLEREMKVFGKYSILKS
jgi:CheY-like chemotaxis protein